MASVENLLMRGYQVALWISLDERLLSLVFKKVVSWLWRMRSVSWLSDVKNLST